MKLPEYEPPNDAVGIVLLFGIAISAGLSMKFVVDTWGEIGELAVLPIFVGTLGLLLYLSPD